MDIGSSVTLTKLGTCLGTSFLHSARSFCVMPLFSVLQFSELQVADNVYHSYLKWILIPNY